jgi:hypothetical protein
MKRKQKNIYSLLDRIGSELTDVAQMEKNSSDGVRDLQEGDLRGPATEVVPEGLNSIKPNDCPDGKAKDLENVGDRTSSDFIYKELCPQCKKAGLVRVKRQRWMRLLSKSRHYLCLECEARLLIVGRLQIKLRKGGA